MTEQFNLQKTGCTSYKKLSSSLDKSEGAFRLSNLDAMVAIENKATEQDAKLAVYANFFDKFTGNKICEGEINSCVDIVKNYYCHNPLYPCSNEEVIRYQFESGHFVFECA